MRKVLLVTPNLEYHGASKQLVLVATGLPRARFALRVSVLGEDGPVAEPLRAAGVEVEVLGWRRLLDVNPFLRLRRLVETFRPDVVHAWRMPSLRAVRLFGSRKFGRLFVSVGGEPLSPGSVCSRPDQWLLGRADYIIASHPGEVNHWHQLGLAADRVKRIPPGVAPAPMTDSAGLGLWHSLGLNQSARLLICVGPLEPGKGFRDAIWAFDILGYLYDDLHLVLLGAGTERRRLEQFVHVIRAANRVHFAGYQPDVPALLSQADVVWVPSRVDRGMNVALEGMAAGRPVVASRLPSLAEVVAEGETGFLVTPGDKVALARQTRLLLDDAERRRRMGEAGRKRVECYFKATDLVDRVACLYESATAEC